MDIAIKKGHIVVEGYPDASRLAKLPEQPYGKRLADLRLHENDLKYCQEAMERYTLHRLTPQNTLDNNTYLFAILAKYFACFKFSAARESLKKEMVFNQNNGALAAFKDIEALRDKHIMHDDSPLTTGTSCVVLGQNANVIDILSLNMHGYFPDDHMFNNLKNLISDAQKYVASEIKTCLKECRQWLTTLKHSELESFSDVKNEWSPNKFKQTRSY